MNIELNEVEYCKINVKVDVDKDYINKKTDEILTRIKPGIKVSGFRQGNATFEAIKVKYKKQLHDMVKQELAQDSFSQAVSIKNIKPFGYPQYTDVTLNDKEFSCSFNLNTKPNVELNQYKDLELPPFHPTFNADEMCQKVIQDLRVKYATTTAFTEIDEVNLEDNIIIDCQTFFEDGSKVDELTFNGELLTVGKNTLPGFDNNLLGLKINDERIFDLKIPETFGNEKVRDKTLNFKVKLTMGSKITNAPLDDTLAEKLSLKTLDELFTQARSAAHTRLSDLEKECMYNQVSIRLLENHDFKVPEWLSLGEAQLNANTAKQKWNEISDEEKEKFIRDAEKSIKLSLILDAVRSKEPDSQMTDTEAYEEAKLNLSKFTTSEKEMNTIFQDLSNNGQLSILLGRVKDDYTLSFIVKNSKIITE